MTKAHRQKLYIFFVLLFFCSLFALFFSLADGKSAAADSSFDGTGTKADPYLIETKEDFIAFADEVNGGMSFDGKYFLQTQDIDFESELLSPVGTYGEGNYFYGTYDGGGHRLYNVNIDEGTTGYAGLFGTLGGSVYNLGIESGTIKGYCAGSFAANAAGGTAEIFNCYSRAEITSVLRGGGIADNFAGLVYNCVSMATNNGSYADLCSYNGRLVHNSYTLGNNINAVVSRDQVITDSECVSESEVKTLSFSYTMNGGVFDFAEVKGDMFFYRDYSFWTVRSGLLCFASSSSSLITASSEWEGDGSKEDPYLISSASDFQLLIERVNGGETYTGLYFKQTADIDFGYRPMKSIGIVGTGTAFYGTYDGAGHTLYRYCVDNGAGYNTGVFGLLGGKVMNLGLEEGYLFGECIGAISVNSVYGYTVIYNCYSKATMYGYRGGGIADNFSGMIFNCVSDATINGKTAPLGAYLIRDVEYCYSTGKIVSTNYFETSNENVTVTVAQLYSASVTEALNYNAMILSVNNGMCALAETANWHLDGSGGYNG